MVELLVTYKENKTYTLQNIQTKQRYVLRLTFFDMNKEICQGDILEFHKELLDPNYSEYSDEYYFGALDKPYGRKIENYQHKDVICVNIKGEKIFLKRFFG